MSALIGLNATDGKILDFVVLLHGEQLLDEAVDCLGELSSVRLFQALSFILDNAEPDTILFGHTAH